MPRWPATRPRFLLLACLVGAFVLGAGASLVGGPRTPQLGSASTGDLDLVTDVRAALGSDRGYPSLSVVRVQDGRTSFAGLGGWGRGASGRDRPTPQTPYELGSITKTFTGLLLADAVERGELRLADPVSRYLTELRGTPAGDATLAQLATHTAGLPAFPDAMMSGVLWRSLTNENTYDGSTAAMLDATRSTEVTAPGRYQYSNLGMSLLGHAEARAAGAADWPTLLTNRLLGPLGMQHTYVALTRADVPSGAAPPRNENGWPAANWYGPAFAPAGSSTWTTAEDLGIYAIALLAGRVPGRAALDPMAPIDGGEIGLAWHLHEVAGRQLTWHNGATGGYRSMLALDRDRGQAVVVLTNSTRSADLVGMRLASTLAGSSVAAVNRTDTPWVSILSWSIVGLGLLASFAATMLKPRTRLALVTAGLSGVTGLLVLLAHGPWSLVPAWVWGGLTGASVVLATLGVARWRPLPGYADRRRVLGGLSLAGTVAVLGFAVWTI